MYISPKAGQDLEAIGDYIAQDNPEAALQFVLNLRKQCQRIAKYPLAYREKPELGKGIRIAPVGRYLVFFKLSENEVTIVRILHGARDMNAFVVDDDELTEAKQHGRE